MRRPPRCRLLLRQPFDTQASGVHHAPAAPFAQHRQPPRKRQDEMHPEIVPMSRRLKDLFHALPASLMDSNKNEPQRAQRKDVAGRPL